MSHLFLATLLLLSLLQHLLNNLLLLNQESAYDAVSYTVGAPRASIRSLHGLLGLGNRGVLAWSQGGNLSLSARAPALTRICTYTWKFCAAVTALGCSTSLLDVQVSELTSRRLDDADLVRAGVVSVDVMLVVVCAVAVNAGSGRRTGCVDGRRVFG